MKSEGSTAAFIFFNLNNKNPLAVLIFFFFFFALYSTSSLLTRGLKGIFLEVSQTCRENIYLRAELSSKGPRGGGQVKEGKFPEGMACSPKPSGFKPR